MCLDTGLDSLMLPTVHLELLCPTCHFFQHPAQVVELLLLHRYLSPPVMVLPPLMALPLQEVSSDLEGFSAEEYPSPWSPSVVWTPGRICLS